MLPTDMPTDMRPQAFPPPRIAALRADDSAAVQALMAAFAHGLAREGFRVAGVVQTRAADPAGRRRIVLRDLENNALYPISQDLGPGSVACNLDSGELALACAAIERAARGGADLVVISKFSKQEAAGGGLRDAFRAGVASRTPILCAVSPHYLEEWRVFAGALAEYVAPEHGALAQWWERARTRPRRPV